MSPNSPSDLPRNRDQVMEAIRFACLEADRNPSSVRLIAVSKKHTAEKILAMIEAGQIDFGENYLQEATEKIAQLPETGPDNQPLQWHFIGHIQSRKCREIALHFDWVHTVESLKVARKLDAARGELANSSPLNVLIQVNIDDEASKSGVSVENLPALVADMAAFGHLSLRGLMIIPMATSDVSKQHVVFARCRELFEQIHSNLDQARGADFDQLSMGMSGDMTAAIAEGATMVRIGTALFGQRDT